MPPVFPFNPLELLLQGFLQTCHLIVVVLWALPFWAEALLFVLLVVSARSPWLLTEPSLVRRRHRRRPRRRRLDWYDR